MADDVLKKPVHIAVLKPTHLEKLADAGKISATPFGVSPKSSNISLPKLEVEKTGALGLPKLLKQQITSSGNLVKQNKQHLKLRVLHDSVPPIPKDKIPPCSSCKTAACCRAFVVNITQLEYESGMYGDAAIKLTPEIHDQLKSRFIMPAVIGAPITKTDRNAYYLEGKIGDPCPFLTAEQRCGIYEFRPVTCRAYTCAEDPRITDGMRSGTEPIDTFTLARKKL